jgi:hypothetical protein
MKNTESLMGAKLKSKTHLLNTFLHFLAVFCSFGFKVFKKIVLQKSKRYQKIAEFHADFESVEKLLKNAQKKIISKISLTNMSKSAKKLLISVTFLLITFWCIFSKLFQRIPNQQEILRFSIPILNF